MPSKKVETIIAGLIDSGGRDFEKAVAEAFKVLGLHATQIEETQGEADVLISAHYCEKPFGVVVECQAKEGQGQIGIEKVGQIRSHFTRYLKNFRWASKVFLCVVGRPFF